ncbi:MAG: HEAT repeat domain-containing protein [Sedimentisphaerales bacterium]|nr:HEAT repeat domain-containing protein [Sedimentisphaerales bacterium]
MAKAIFFWSIIFISFALVTEAKALPAIETQAADDKSDAKAKNVGESARQTALSPADSDTINKLAEQLANTRNIASSKKSWDEWNAALASAKILIEQQPVGQRDVFEPLLEPLFSVVGYGGEIHRQSKTAAGLMASIGKPANEFLLEKLKSAEARERWSTVQILTEIGEPNAPIVSAIRPLLADKDDYVRQVAINNLGRFGERARPAAEDIKAAFNDTFVSNRIYARLAYIRIGHSEPEHIYAIAEYLKAYDDDDKNGAGVFTAAALAATVLGDLGPAAAVAEPNLIDALNCPKAQVRLNAAHALAAFGTDSNPAIDRLIELLKHDISREVRRTAASSLGMIGPKAQDAIVVLAEILRQADKESRNDPKSDYTGWYVAARAVGQIGGASAVAVLEEALKNNDPDIRRTAARFLENIRQKADTPATPERPPL